MKNRAFPFIMIAWLPLSLFGLFPLAFTQMLSGPSLAISRNRPARIITTVNAEQGLVGGRAYGAITSRLVLTTSSTVYLPMVQRDLQYAAGEPNDECGAAYPIQPNLDYAFLPEDLHDWYHFDLPVTSNLAVSVTNFVPELGQVAVYRGSPGCGDYIFLENNGTPGVTKLVDVGQQPAGHYYIYVSNDGPPTDIPYTLRANFTP